MAQRMSYKIKSVQEQEVGCVGLTLRIQNVDLKKLLESLPEGISSAEAARAAMLERSIEAEFIDIRENVANLRAFLHLRDTESCFESIRA